MPNVLTIREAVQRAKADGLQHRKIVIDPRRTPNAHREFVNYAYPVDKNGQILSQLVDKDNHCIDAAAYGLTRVIFSRQYSA